jgi:hypothetical protein
MARKVGPIIVRGASGHGSPGYTLGAMPRRVRASTTSTSDESEFRPSCCPDARVHLGRSPT